MTLRTKTARIGVDVGGTFTDLVLHDEARNILHMGKLLTTPHNPSIAIVEGVKRLLDETGLVAADLHSIVHGTTLVTNAIIERRGAKVGLITTDGFRDSTEIGRETRYDLYDLFLDMPAPLVSRALRMEVAGRLSASGEELLPLDREAVLRATKILVEEQKVEALAVAFLHSYVDPRHELEAAEIIHAAYPDLPLTLSAQVAPEIREYERGVTACANAYVQPMMIGYLSKLENSLAAMGFSGNLYIMLSSGGITTVEEVRNFPIRIIESGPAAGAMAASFISRLAGFDKIISFDMGGTTAKMCLIEDNEPHHKYDFEAGRVRRFQKGSGLPLKISVIDMIEIGAGGGSIAGVDKGSGLMKVGPRSAGSVPGPVCYGRGGAEPTVTDSDLVTGRLDAAYFLGGEMALDLDAVKLPFQTRISDHIKVSLDDAALGVQRIVDETMAAATRMHCAEKGKDPRRHTMIAFGGAGPVHAWNLARLLKVPRLVVPMGAGVASALGFLVAPPATDMAKSYRVRLDRVVWERVNAMFGEMAEQGRKLLKDAGALDEDITLVATAEMRHVGQGFEVSVQLPGIALQKADEQQIAQAFLRTYREQFERSLDGTPIEILTWRLKCEGRARTISVGEHFIAERQSLCPRTTRKVLFEEAGWLDCPVYDRYQMVEGDEVAGPALFEERESTCCVGPNSKVRVDRYRNLVIELG
ncbi:methylhydantoinase [Rhizobium sp. ACO-34A]|nr:hydantoinase/oxoprolinase family protein [Rhizobium sp. ACO-34A]ATN32317.1 methylhydantoinase [Rhizobium sp. ACO-34A]